MTTEQRLPLSVCMISGAEAHRIRRALDSVAGWTSEIIVVINEDVSDDTDRIAASYGARVSREPWKGHIAQKNSAAQKAGSDWILGLDADEVVSPELRAEMEQLFAEPGKLQSFTAFNFPRCTYFCGRWIRHGDWYPDHQTRLWRRGTSEWGGVDPHDKLLVHGAVGRLHHDLLHYNAETIDQQIGKISRYSEDFLRDAVTHRRSASWFDLVVRPAWRFARSYFFRLGLFDGWQGGYIAWMTAFYTATRYAKIRASQKQKSKPD
jgi:glycosyltransferase involved in cell wall biosynthesis